MAVCGNQYFDVFKPREKEFFIDAGGFDGNSTIEFVKWAGNSFKGAMVFEPIKGMYDIIKNKCDSLSNISIVNSATWNRTEKLIINDDGSSSSITNNGKYEIQGVDIDSCVKDKHITFIKMDVEGSELKSLEGAKNTIINYRPRLAICIYHKSTDVIDLSNYILELVPDYKFWIRHYYSNIFETVLYAQ